MVFAPLTFNMSLHCCSLALQNAFRSTPDLEHQVSPGVLRPAVATTCTDGSGSNAPMTETLADKKAFDAFLSGAIRVVDTEFFSFLPLPWPRQQDAERLGNALLDGPPAPEDLFVCVSHGWPYQMHPDPRGTIFLHLKRIPLFQMAASFPLSSSTPLRCPIPNNAQATRCL